MHKITTWICDQCGEPFEDELKCKSHELNHIKNVLDYTGLLTVQSNEGWDVRYLGRIPVQDILETMIGHIVRIYVVEKEENE